MSIFPVIFIGVLAFCHVYIFWRFRSAFAGSRWQYAVLTVLLLGLASIFLRPRLSKTTHGPLFVNLMFSWLGFMAVMTIVLVCRDALFVILRLWDRVGDANWASALAGPKSIRVALALGVFAFGYSLLEARTVRTTRVTLTTDRLPQSWNRVRVVAVSDVHLTARNDEKRLRRLVVRINAERPDIVVMLGDLVDDWILDLDELSAELRNIEAPQGKFAVLGNHEFYNGTHQSVDFIAKSGFRLLRGESADAGPLSVVGVDDPAFRERAGVASALGKAGADRFVLLLTHRPEAVDDAFGMFDLQLSGHTHGGQLVPARLVTWLMFGHGQGMKELAAPRRRSPSATEAGVSGKPSRRSRLYLTNGAGYWGPPVRFLAPPEIVVIDIVRADAV